MALVAVSEEVSEAMGQEEALVEAWEVSAVVLEACVSAVERRSDRLAKIMKKTLEVATNEILII